MSVKSSLHSLLELLQKKSDIQGLSQSERQQLEQGLKKAIAQDTSLQGKVKNLEAELAQIKRSRSWTLTAPLRALRRGKKTAGLPAIIAPSRDIRPIPPTYVEETKQTLPDTLAASLYAFYLPQFHAIAENDKWWGEGFTEWTNVRPAKPQFPGHDQPHMPDEQSGLGYYDLTDPSVMARQIKMAKDHGVEGFCFYFYWFAGHRLLEKPLLNLLDNPTLDVPFMLCWANENWSRRWDGRDDDVLMAQDHSEDDDIAFIRYVSKYLKDPRYRRIDGKPVLLVYRPIELPDAKATAARWRDWCRDNGIGDIYLAYTQSFEDNNPRDYGFDGAVEFPPNNSNPPDVTDRVIDVADDFTGKIYDWDIFPKRSDNYGSTNYPLFRSVCPGWDNTARRKNNGTVFINNTPARYSHWLRNAVIDTAHNHAAGDRLVFVNAWNEWAEGAHLEPDASNGFSYLTATRDTLLGLDEDTLEKAVQDATRKSEKRIVIVTHDAHPMGAQILSLNLRKTLQDDYSYIVDFVTLGDGPMMDQYRVLDNFHDLSGHAADSPAARDLAARLKDRADIAICNTTVSGLYAAILKKAGFRVLSLVHELEKIIRDNNLENHADAITAHADTIVFPATLVQKSFQKFTGPLGDKAVICPQGAYKRNRFTTEAARTEAGNRLRETLGLPRTSRIILGVGYADHRKGYNLFLQAAEALATTQAHIVFVWMGHHDPETQSRYKPRVDALVNAGNLVLPGRVDDTDMYYAGADVYLLTSREDPYPSTVLEALDVGLPVIGFDGATGTVDLIRAHRGHIVPAFDVAALVAATKRLLITAGPNMRNDIAARFQSRDDVSFTDYVRKVLGFLGETVTPSKPPIVSVVIPNYNYAHYLPLRVKSVTDQTVPVSQIILLDDCSTDDSPAVLDSIEAGLDIPVTRIDNQKNSGSVFAQWRRGVEAASGEFVWIAEADDLAEPEFLAKLLPLMRNPNVVMAYCQSKQIDKDGHVTAPDYHGYTDAIHPTQWRADYVRSGAEEIIHGLSVKNTIPNVSGVLMRREALLSVLDTHFDHIKQFRVAGDWALYVHMLCKGDIVFVSDALNLHRRHDDSVTLSRFGRSELDAIQSMQDYIAANFKVAEPMRDKAKAYIDELRAQYSVDVS